MSHDPHPAPAAPEANVLATFEALRALGRFLAEMDADNTERSTGDAWDAASAWDVLTDGPGPSGLGAELSLAVIEAGLPVLRAAYDEAVGQSGPADAQGLTTHHPDPADAAKVRCGQNRYPATTRPSIRDVTCYYCRGMWSKAHGGG